jgi:hypothetical protein
MIMVETPIVTEPLEPALQPVIEDAAEVWGTAE